MKELPPLRHNSLGLAAAMNRSESRARRSEEIQSAWVTRALYFEDFRPHDRADGSRDKYSDLSGVAKVRIEDTLAEIGWLSRFPNRNIEVVAVIYQLLHLKKLFLDSFLLYNVQPKEKEVFLKVIRYELFVHRKTNLLL